MTHYTEDELILHFYGESRRSTAVERHLDACPACAALYADIAAAMKLVVAPRAPERGDRYGLEVWQRIRPLLPAEEPSHSGLWGRWNQLAFGGAIAAIIVAAFVAGRIWPRPPATFPSPVEAQVPAMDASDRVRLAAIGDHLEQSERLLLDLVNAGGQVVDVTDQQAWASDLVDANRFYREAAMGAGDTLVAEVLDDLERNLLEIVHGPSTLNPADLERMRMRLDTAALLFKVRVLADALHERETANLQPRKTT